MNGEAKVLVIGGNGSLGRELLRILPNAIGTSRGGGDHHALDITDAGQVQNLVERVGPACVVNTAAMTSVDGCERDPDGARLVHVDATRHLVDACCRGGSRLIHFSTNYVFDGRSGPYSEDDPTNPLGVYGQTKLESESIVLDSDLQGVVVRTAVFYGPENGKPNFLTWALRELVLGHPIRIVTDEWANPTYVPDLAEAVARIVSDARIAGCFHGAGPDYFTRYEMIVALCETFGLDQDLVTPVRGEDLGQAAARPKRAGLVTDAIQKTVGGVFQPYRQNLGALKRLIGDLDTWARPE